MKANIFLPLLMTVAFQAQSAGIVAVNKQNAADPPVSQSVTAASYANGDYDWFTKRSGTWYFDLESEKRNVEFTKNAKGEVSEIKMGKYVYKGDQHGKSEFVRYFAASESSWHLYFTPKSIIIFDGDVGGMTSVKGCLKSKCKEADLEKMEVFLKEGLAMQADDIKKYNEKKAEEDKLAALEKEKQFSIKDKEVVKLEIINLNIPEKFGHFSNFKFDIKATLKDGSVLSTDQGGFKSDYTISYAGGDYSEDKIQGKFNNEDKIKVTITSKFNPKNTVSTDVVLLYNQDIKFSYNGTSWSRGAGESANNFRIEVKQMKHKVKGNELVAVRITNVTTGVVVSEFKMSVENTFYFNCKGGNGGSDNGSGRDGGNGGNITIVKDPTVKTFNISYENYGGKGGKGSNNNYNGNNGRDGAVKEEVRAVTF